MTIKYSRFDLTTINKINAKKKLVENKSNGKKTAMILFQYKIVRKKSCKIKSNENKMCLILFVD